MWRRNTTVSKLLLRMLSTSSQCQYSTISSVRNFSPSSIALHGSNSSRTDDTHRSLMHSSFSFPSIQRRNNCTATEVDPEAGEPETSAYSAKIAELLALLNESQEEGSLKSSLNQIFAEKGELSEGFLLELIHSQSSNLPPNNFFRFLEWVSLSKQKIITSSIIDSLARNFLSPSTSSPLWSFIKQCAEDSKVFPSDIYTFHRLLSFLPSENEILDAFTKIPEFDLVPDSECHYLTFVSLCKASSHDHAWDICQKMLEAEVLPENTEKLGTIIRLLCKAGRASDAHLIYTYAKSSSKSLRFGDLSKLIGSLSRSDETVTHAAKLLDDIPDKDLNAAIKPFSLVIRGLCRTKEPNEAMSLLNKMILKGPPPGHDVFNRIITCYSKNGDMEASKSLMKTMDARGLTPDLYAYTVIISGYVRLGLMEEALAVFSSAKESHKKLTPVTYHSLIRGYCKMEKFDEAMGLFREMRSFGVNPNVHEYNTLIQSLCLKGLDWKTSEGLMGEMRENGLHLNGITKGLIGAVKELRAEVAV